MSFTTHPSARGVARTALSLGTAATLVATLGAPASFAAPAQANSAERAKAHTTISSLSSAQQKAGFNRFVITYTDSALNAGGINWASPAGTQVATWNDALYQGLTSEVKSVDDLFKIKTNYVRTTAQKATVVTLSSKLTAEQAEKYMATLSSNPSVASVEPDLLRRSTARARGAATSKVAQVAQASNQVVAPNDTLYPQQWNLHGTKGISAPEAWKTTQGAGVTVAVIDSGIVKHPDLDANVLPGYDFITEPSIARDGNGRDSDPTDQGNWEEAGVCDADSEASESNWHGTHVAGSIAAIMNNKRGIVGVAPSTKILPVRALGMCGGYDSDIADAMVWAAGGTVEGVPANSNPAKIINLSLGGEGTCPATYSKAIAEVNKRGAILVVAAGNDGQDTSKVAPANCGGSIVVGATDQEGKRSDFSNYGKLVDVSAPGSSIMSTVDLGTTVSKGAGYTEYDGTSMAAPQVAGIIALMKSVDPSLNAERAKQILKQTSKPLTCDVNACGSGIVNAASALAMVQGKKDPNPTAKPWPKRAPKHPTRAARVGYVTNPAVNHNPPFLITPGGLIPGQ
ncbi:peptidase S8 [Rothia mucilaginosa]|uniref:Peptidase S8 n=1 Tax=Rothia mucilaginosa TaxID=43675 RepID=A0A291DFT1_9MICC|nr:S8 family peptidase [Rothia mucilaginosa]ATF63391.1 peptidase S8 [Rothia mucilaginosa]